MSKKIRKRHWYYLSGKRGVFAYTDSYGPRVEVKRHAGRFIASRKRTRENVLFDRRGYRRTFESVEQCVDAVDDMLREAKPPAHINSEPTIKVSLGTIAELVYAHIDYSHHRFFSLVSEIVSDADREQSLKLQELVKIWGPRSQAGAEARREVMKIVRGWRPRRSYKPAVKRVLLELGAASTEQIIARCEQVLGWSPPTKALKRALEEADIKEIYKKSFTQASPGVYKLTRRGHRSAVRLANRHKWPVPTTGRNSDV